MIAPSWRSLLYVPLGVERFIAGAARAGADAVVLDLEDGVAADGKRRARRCLGPAVARLASDVEILVRINPSLLAAAADLDVAVIPGVSAIVAAKVSGAEHVRMLAAAIRELEIRRGLPVGQVGLVPLVETPQAALVAADIAAAHPRVRALGYGDEDLAAELGCDAGPGLDPLRTMLVVAAAAAGCTPLGLMGSIANYRDLEALRASALRARAAGFIGAFCIHPAQVATLNAAFAPTSEELAAARMIISTFEAARRSGHGAVGVAGSMVDAPVVRRAQAQLARHAATSRKM